MESGRAQNPLVAKLLQFTPLADEDIRVLQALCSSEERFKGNVDILVKAPRHVRRSLSHAAWPAAIASCRTVSDRS